MEDSTKQSADGLKELNIATEDFYNEKMNEEDQLKQDEDKPQKTIYDHIRIGFIIISYVIFFFADLNNRGFALMTFAIFLFTIAVFFMKAIKKFITEGDNCSLLFRASFFLRIILLLFFFLSLSMIFWTKKYNLNYSYWIALISFITIATIEILETTVEDYRKRKNYGLLSRIFRILLNLFLLILWLNSIGMIIRVSPGPERRTLVVNQVETPYEILLIKQDHKISSGLEVFMSNSITISDHSFLNQFTEDLENRSYVPMDIISVLNYSKLEHMAEEYYQLYLFYHERDNVNIFASHSASITFIEDKLVLRYQAFQSDRWLLNNKINDYYYLELSEETRNKLQSYIDKVEE